MSEKMSKFPELHRLWNYSAPEETAVRFYDLLPTVEKSNEYTYHVELLTQIARTHSLPLLNQTQMIS